MTGNEEWHSRARDIIRPNREESGIDREAQGELGHGRGGRTFRAGLPGSHGGWALTHEPGEITLAQACQMSGQGQSGAIEESGDFGRAIRRTVMSLTPRRSPGHDSSALWVGDETNRGVGDAVWAG